MGDSSTEIPRDYAPKNYALSGKIMLSAIIILFTVVVLIVCLHMYARWFLIRARRRQHNHRRTRRRTHFIFSSTDPTTPVIAPSRGLDATILKSLPMFIYSSNTHEEALECAVCLSEFEENEKGRVLPKCNHSFHIDCIDMWFHSHTTCPLCRSHVQPETLVPGPVPAPVMEHQVSILISHGEYAESEAEPSSGLCSSCRHHENNMGSSSSSSTSTSMVPLASRRKPLELMGISVEVFRRNDSFRNLEEEVGLGSPSGQGFKSPGSRLRSLRRILSRDRKAVVSSSPSSSSSSSATALSSNSATETDLERGEEPKTQLNRQSEKNNTQI